MNENNYIDILNKINLLSKKVEKTLDLIDYYPKYFSLANLASEVGRPRQTLRNHLIANYEPECDFVKKNGSIHVTSKVFVEIRKKYDNKNN